LIDRPYTEEDAKHYIPLVHDKLPNINTLLKAALSIVPPGGKVGVLDYFVPRPPKKGVKFVGLVGVLVGFGNRLRAFSVFEREPVKTAEQKRRVSEAILGKKKPKE
jgi:xanthosine utilization system XapX-like protein